MGMAPAAHVLFNKFMTFNPKSPDWLNRDRFILSYVIPHAYERPEGAAGDEILDTLSH